jgi:hypothetical protein
MTISERVYRSLLLAYPAAFRREYGESLMQLFRDQMRDCSGRWGTRVLLWMRMLADTFRAAPAMHLETVTGPEGWLMKSRAALAALLGLLLMEAESLVLKLTVFQIRTPFTRAFQAHRPSDPVYRWMYLLGVFSGIRAVEVILALALFLLVLRRFSLGSLARGALAGVAAAVAGGCALNYVFVFRYLESGHAVVSWLLPVAAVAVFATAMRKLGIGALVRWLLAGVAVAAPVISSLGYRVVPQPALITYTAVSAIVLTLFVAGILLMLKRLGVGWPARGILAALPAVAAGIGFLPMTNYDLLLYHEAIPAHILMYFAGAYLLPICLAAAAWAAIAWGQRREEVRTDLAPRIPA